MGLQSGWAAYGSVLRPLHACFHSCSIPSANKVNLTRLFFWRCLADVVLILGLETSCDETGVALYHPDHGVLAEALHSQVAMHAEYGGVVPELASRDHIRRVMPLLRGVMADAGKAFSELDGVAYTAGPGLIGALMVGAGVGRSLAYALDIPAIGVHHMEGHLLAPLMGAVEETPGTAEAPEAKAPLAKIEAEKRPKFPFVALLVSGGHTQLVKVDAIGRYRLLGDTVDDAAGEAFDKAAKMLGLSYPGGPAIAGLAPQGDAKRFRFPRPMTDRPGLDFSFSGLKTYTRNAIAELHPLSSQDTADIARAFEDAVVDTLYIKCRRALEQTACEDLIIAGGVSANLNLRHILEQKLKATVHYAPPALCTDNGAMIAFAGYHRLCAGQLQALAIETRARWPLEELEPLTR